MLYHQDADFYEGNLRDLNIAYNCLHRAFGSFAPGLQGPDQELQSQPYEARPRFGTIFELRHHARLPHTRYSRRTVDADAVFGGVWLRLGIWCPVSSLNHRAGRAAHAGHGKHNDVHDRDDSFIAWDAIDWMVARSRP